MNELKEIVTERPMSSARAIHILTVRMKETFGLQLFYIILGTNRVTFVLLLDLVALERACLVGITVGLHYNTIQYNTIH